MSSMVLAEEFLIMSRVRVKDDSAGLVATTMVRLIATAVLRASTQHPRQQKLMELITIPGQEKDFRGHENSATHHDVE